MGGVFGGTWRNSRGDYGRDMLYERTINKKKTNTYIKIGKRQSNTHIHKKAEKKRKEKAPEIMYTETCTHIHIQNL